MSQSAGFEPALPEGIWFRVRRLNHSATTAYIFWQNRIYYEFLRFQLTAWCRWSCLCKAGSPTSLSGNCWTDWSWRTRRVRTRRERPELKTSAWSDRMPESICIKGCNLIISIHKKSYSEETVKWSRGLSFQYFLLLEVELDTVWSSFKFWVVWPDVSVQIGQQDLCSSFSFVELLQHQVGHEESGHQKERVHGQRCTKDHHHGTVIVNLFKFQNCFSDCRQTYHSNIQANTAIFKQR